MRLTLALRPISPSSPAPAAGKRMSRGGREVDTRREQAPDQHHVLLLLLWWWSLLVQ